MADQKSGKTNRSEIVKDIKKILIVFRFRDFLICLGIEPESVLKATQEYP